MKKMMAPYGVFLVAALALTGCGGSGTAAASASAGNAATASTAVPAAASASASATESAAAAKTYTNDELAAMITKLKDAHGKAFTVVPAAQIDQGLQLARKVLKTAVITPKACAVLATNNAQVPEGSTYAAGSSLSAAEKTVTTVTVFAVKDASAMAEQLGSSQKAASQCTTVTISMGGRKIVTKVVPVRVTTNGDTSLGALTSETAPTGQKTSTLTVTAVKGNLAATAVKSGAATTAAASAELVKLVNAVLSGQ